MKNSSIYSFNCYSLQINKAQSLNFLVFSFKPFKVNTSNWSQFKSTHKITKSNVIFFLPPKFLLFFVKNLSGRGQAINSIRPAVVSLISTSCGRCRLLVDTTHFIFRPVPTFCRPSAARMNNTNAQHVTPRSPFKHSRLDIT